MMKEFINLRQFYKPIQPTISHTNKNVFYTEYLPDINLQPYIYCYWELKTNNSLTENFNYKVVADSCIDVYFQVNNPSDSYIMGFCDRFTEFELPSTFHYFGIRFLPGMFTQLFQVNAKELSNRSELLHAILPDMSRFLSNRLNAEQNSNEIINLLDRYFLALPASKNYTRDSRLYEAIDIILKNKGVINIESDLQTGLSSRHLRRLFEFHIGDTPKSFCKIVRFQNILYMHQTTQRFRKDKLYFDAGYYDQAHLIRDFRKLFGVSPSRALKS